jgi:hypothetical protein
LNGLNFGLNWRVLKTFLQIYAETDEDRDPLDVSTLPANGALILAALRLRWPRVRGNEKCGNVVLCPTRSLIVSHRAFGMPRGTAGCGGRRKSHATTTRRLYCLPPRIATCYPRAVNRNIFYVIGVIVVIIIVLKVLGVF